MCHPLALNSGRQKRQEIEEMQTGEVRRTGPGSSLLFSRSVSRFG